VFLLPAHSGPGDAHAADAGGAVTAYVPLAILALVWVGYLRMVTRARAKQGWAVRHTIAFTVGLALVSLALSPGFDEFADNDFSGHAAQHLLLAMVAPLLLVLGMPMTLLLRTLPRAAARRLGSLLNTGPVHRLTTPVVALGLSSGGLVVLYFTPLYQLSRGHPGVHALVHAHMLLAGFLFAWVITGLDPDPGRASLRSRLVVLGLSIAIHSSVSQLLYAGLLVQVREPVTQMQAAGSLMYFGGDIAVLLLAWTLLLTARSGPADRLPRASRAADTTRLTVESVRPPRNGTAGRHAHPGAG
jgi:putative membrane protein